MKVAVVVKDSNRFFICTLLVRCLVKLSAAIMATKRKPSLQQRRRQKIDQVKELRYRTAAREVKILDDLPCLTDTYLVLEAATKLACGRESSSENNSSFVTVLDLVFKAARDPMGAK